MPNKSWKLPYKNCPAVLWEPLLLQPYLELSRFIIRTDHEALKGLLTSASNSGKLARWELRLLEFGFEVVHGADKKRQAPDASPRLKTERSDNTNLDKELLARMTK